MAMKLNNRIQAEKLLYFLSSSRISRFNKSRYQCSRFVQTNARAIGTSGVLSDNTLRPHRSSNVFSRDLNNSLKNYTFPSVNLLRRAYSSQQQDDDGSTPEVPEEKLPAEPSEIDFPVTHSLPATVVVPEHWPNVPLIAVSRNPVFPRFIKLLEVSFCEFFKSWIFYRTFLNLIVYFRLHILRL